MKIIGNGHWIEIEYEQPEWSDDQEACFKYLGETWWLGEFMRNEGELLAKGFHGYKTMSYFNAILIKIHDSGDAVQAFRASW